tara:strand:+ start:874 stop:1320 length:447 start_codon:yes stop_codon:yes gene_type:complete
MAKKSNPKKFIDDGQGVVLYDAKGKEVSTKAEKKKKSSSDLTRIASALRKTAAPSKDKLNEIFDKLKKGMKVEVAWKGGMSSSKPHERVVGRKSHSKKYNITSYTLERADGQKSSRMSKVKLMKRHSSGNVSLALGDMGVTIEHLEIK